MDAQVLYGLMVGSVTDASGAPVPGASVKLLQHETNQAREASTNDTGQFSFATIPSGTYTVTIGKPGFQTFLRKDVTLTINSVVRVDATLQVGALSETVEVTAQSAALQTDRAEVRAEVTAKTLENLPVPTGRNYQGLFRMIPGFAPPTNTGSVVANPARGLAVGVNGTSRTSVNVRIDGASATNTPHFSNPGGNVNNLQLNSDGSVRTTGGFSEITSTSGVGREGIDERVVRLGLHFRF
jgi:hypothetical protein